jgi:hypothetical protein
VSVSDLRSHGAKQDPMDVAPTPNGPTSAPIKAPITITSTATTGTTGRRCDGLAWAPPASWQPRVGFHPRAVHGMKATMTWNTCPLSDSCRLPAEQTDGRRTLHRVTA